MCNSTIFLASNKICFSSEIKLVKKSWHKLTKIGLSNQCFSEEFNEKSKKMNE